MVSSNGTPPASASGFLAALLGIQPDVLQAPPLPLAPRQTQAIRAAPPKNAPKPVPPTPALMKVLRFIADIAPGSGEGIAAAELLKATKKGKAGDAAWAALGLVPVVGDATKAATKGARATVKSTSRRGIEAWHGSPHKFDRFDLSKLGTGEGAQSFGHGLYFAEARPVAQSYRRAGAPTWIGADAADMAVDAFKQAQARGLSGQEARTAATFSLYERALDVPQKERQRLYDAINNFDELIDKAGPGHLYRVKLDVDEDELLDWDAPINKQPGQIQRAVRDASGYLRTGAPRDFGANYWHEPTTGGQAYKLLEGDARTHAQAAEALRTSGVPGIKYFDSGSRGGLGGTRNFVMFDDQRVRILETLAIMGLLGGAGAAGGRDQQ